ncbi:MAG: ethylbenzene dehydrogenase-related protein [Methylococcales bacterium]
MKIKPLLDKTMGLGFAGAVFMAPAMAATVPNGATLPAYVQQLPSGSQDDLRTQAVYDELNGKWTLTFRRKLNTGDNSRDIQFELGKSYAFQVATFDHNTGAATALDSSNVGHLGDKTAIYTVTLPGTLNNALTFSATPSKLTSISGKVLTTNEIEITLSWQDASKNDSVGYRTYTFNKKKKKGSWSEDPTETLQDQLSLVWDMQYDNFATAGNCEQMCHQGSSSMGTQNGTVDAWHWEAATSGPIAHAVDEYWSKYTAENPNGRHNDPGLPAYVSNDLLNGHPKYQAENHPVSSSPSRLFLLPAGTKPAVKPTTFPLDGWQSANVLPANVFRPIRGRIADVRSIANHDGTQWTVTFRRSLNTGGDDGHDIAFEKGRDYYFLYSYHNNADHDYSEGAQHALTDPETPFTMHIPDAPGSLVFPVKPAHLNAISGNLLAGDEIEITVSWPDSSRNDNKRQWRFDAANSTDPWTRIKPYSSGTYNANPALNTYIVEADEIERAKPTFSSDRFMFIWDMQGNQFQTTGNCQQMCHTDADPAVRAMKTNAGVLDSWNWTGNSVVSGYPTDSYWDSTGDSISDTGSQSASVSNAALKANGQAPAGTDLNATSLSYTAAGGAGVSATYLYQDSPQADGWTNGVQSFIQSVNKPKLTKNLRKLNKDSLSISGTIDEGSALGLPAAETQIKVGNLIDITIKPNQFKAKSKNKLFTYLSADKSVSVKFDLRDKKTHTFSVALSKQNLRSLDLSKTTEFSLRVGNLVGSPSMP